MDLFLLKKIITAFIMPLSIVVLLLVVALVFFNTKPKLSFQSLLIATLLLVISAFPPFSDLFMGSIEDDYPPFSANNNKSIDYIVVLGCYHRGNDKIPATLQLKTCSLQRLIEAIRIYRLYPNAIIITSGGALGQSSSNAYVVKQAAMSLGVPEDKILTENYPKDTEEEALLIAPRVKNSHVVLVTNAYHLPRAMQYFKQQGVDAIAAPAGYWVPPNKESTGWDYYIPKSHTLTQTTLAWYESLGRAWQKIKAIF